MESHQTTSDKIMKKLMMERMEKIRRQTIKTAKKIMMTLLYSVIFDLNYAGTDEEML